MDRRIDAVMARTHKRPLAEGRVSPVAALAFASIFLFAALAALGGLLLSVYLYRQAPKAREARDA